MKEQISQLRASKEQKQEKLAELQKRKREILHRIDTVYPEYERELLDRYLEYKGNIRVFVRARPILPNDYKAYAGSRDSFDLIER